MQHWKDINFKRTGSALRDDRIKLIDKFKDTATVDKILTLPAGLRDFEIDDSGRQRYDEINNLYWRILSIANTIVSTRAEDNLPILNNPRYSLQMAFNDIYDRLGEQTRKVYKEELSDSLSLDSINDARTIAVQNGIHHLIWANGF
jgi:hypothetical protein